MWWPAVHYVHNARPVLAARHEAVHGSLNARTMPQTKSAEKALRKTVRRTKRNDSIRQNLDYLWRQFKKAQTNNDAAKIEELSKKLIKTLDKAAKRRIIHPNKASRHKSGIMKKINKKK